MFNKKTIAVFALMILLLTVKPIWAASANTGLTAALRATLAHHPSLKGKQVEVQAQGFMVESTKASRLPSISLQANTLNDEFTQSFVRIQQPLWTFGRIGTSIALAEAELSAEELSLQKVQRELIELTAVAYARIEGIHQRQQVTLANITQHQELYNSIVRRNEGQLATDADVQLANSRLVQAKANQLKTTGELQMALTELIALTQIRVLSDEPIKSALLGLPSTSDIESLARINSIDILLKQERVKTVNLEIKKEQVANRPTLSFRVERSFSDSKINTNETRTGLAFEASYGGLGFGSRGRVKSARARYVAAQYDLDATLIEAQREVSTLMLNRDVQQALFVAQEQAVNALNATMESFMRQYQNGLKSWLEVLNTQRELTQLQLELAQMKTEYRVLSMRVATLIGNLDEEAGITAL